MDKHNILIYIENNEFENDDVLFTFLMSYKDNEIKTRTNLFGHITSSAFIVDENKEEALLIYHNKYNKWLSPGGHIEEGETCQQASFREIKEELGLENLNLCSNDIFDIDVHRIPEKIKDGIVEPEHWHFDIRYLYQTNKENNLIIDTKEVNEYKWYKIEDLKNKKDSSISRMASKVEDRYKGQYNTRKKTSYR